MRVIVADDVLLTREGVSHVLVDGGLEVVEQVGDAEALKRAVATRSPDLAVVDIRMPPTHTDEGLVAAQWIKENYPSVSVLVLSQYVESSYAMRLLQDHPEGMGYLLKERVYDAAVLVDAVRRITEHECVIDPTIVSQLMNRARVDNPLSALSAREREVLSLVAEGMSNRGIAAQLFITERTVEAHTKQVFTKLGLDEDPTTNRRILAVLAFLRA